MKFKADIRVEKNRTVMVLTGWIDEHCQWPVLTAPFAGDLVLDVGGVSLLNSLGIRDWIRWLARAEVERDVIFVNCSPVVVKQINILAQSLNERTKVESIQVPYFCEDCGFEETQIVDIPKLELPVQASAVVREYPCQKCGKGMKLDMIESQFLTFIKKQRAKYNPS